MHPFALLGDPVRLRIVEILASGQHRAGELAAAIGGEFGVSRTAVSHQLRTLREAGFVSVYADGNVRGYRLTWDALDQTDRALLALYELWDRRFGWPYTTDPLETPPRRHRLHERARRKEVVEVHDIEPLVPTEDPWDWLRG